LENTSSWRSDHVSLATSSLAGEFLVVAVVTGTMILHRLDL